MSTAIQIEKLNAAGFRAVEKNSSVWVYDGAKYIGCISESDDGTTGTCSRITRRAGAVAAALRAE